jgi:citrate lyase subunit beta / citryl-CoA lyase
MNYAETLANMRTLLAVPGHRPDRFVKAKNSGADAILLDIEDAVGPDLKDDARGNIDKWLDNGGTGLVRINGVGTPWHDQDVAMLAGRECAVLLPKASIPDHVAAVMDRIGRQATVMVLLETSTGILDARAVCGVPGVTRAMFGNVDLATELGIDHADNQALAFARSQVVLASLAAGIAAPIDGLTTVIEDDDALTGDVRHAIALGYTGKLCVHPRQVPIANGLFSPSAEQLDWARAVIAASTSGSVTVVNGQLVAKPVVAQAHRLLARAT